MAWFKVAQAGDTVDGRKIKAEWLTQAAVSYSPKTYSARVWIEHIRGYIPSSDFRAAGYVTALKTETENNVVCLYADIEANDYLKQINKADQKVYASIEITEDFAGTGKVYLTGLGVTDTPASLGTDRLKFSQNSAFSKPLNMGSQSFGITAELDLSLLVPTQATSEADKQTFFKAISDKLTSIFKAEKTVDEKMMTQFAQVVGEQVVAYVAETTKTIEANFAADFAAQKAEIEALNTKLVVAIDSDQQHVQKHGSTRPKNFRWFRSTC